MNKDGFVALVQSKGGYKTKAEAETAIKAFTESVTAALVSRDEISLVGFGSFSTSLQKGKSGNVPGKPGQTYETHDKMVPKFKPGASLKNSVEAGK